MPIMADALADPKLRRELITPEGIDLRLQLATLGERVGAFMLDLAIIVLVLAAFTLLTILALLMTGGAGLSRMQAVAVIWLLGFFVLRNGYFIAFELGMRAATPGKRMMRMRIVARDGGRLTGEAIVARNAMRELELFLPLSFLGYETSQGLADWGTSLAGLAWAGIFLIFPLLNRDRLRVGDLIAGTWVVRQPRRQLRHALVEHRFVPQFQFSEAQLGAYGEFELQKLEEVLRNEEELSVIVVARTIRARIDWTGPAGDDLEFLRAYYTALCQRLERNMLFGNRRRDKYDGKSI
jgi:uncharacterized RDD family membrane protein YckC